MPVPITEALEAAEDTAVAKATMAKTSIGRYLVSAMLAGAFVGVAVVLLLATSSAFVAAQNPGTKLVQGSVFGVALTLVVFAGAELFTGCIMTMVQGLVARKTTWSDLLLVAVASWVGNLVGSMLFAAAVNESGVFSSGVPKGSTTIYLATLAGIVKTKGAASVAQLFFRGVLCNFLVCLGLWMAQRAASDAAKAIVLFWALLAFIASGFEHCVANMTVFSLAIFTHVPGATASEMARNLTWTTLGNIVGGGLVVALSYSYIGKSGGFSLSRPSAGTRPAYYPLDEEELFEDEDFLDLDEAPLVLSGAAPAAKPRATRAKATPAPRTTATVKRATTPPPRTRTTKPGAR